MRNFHDHFQSAHNPFNDWYSGIPVTEKTTSKRKSEPNWDARPAFSPCPNCPQKEEHYLREMCTRDNLKIEKEA